jgi:hypothetical protein
MESLYIYSQDYGVDSTATAADNTKGLIKAVAAAHAANKTLVLPAGIIHVNLSSSVNGTIPITADVRIIGAGRGHTILKAAVTLLDYASILFKVNAGINFTLESMTLQGPDSISGDTTFNASPNIGGIGRDGLDSPSCVAIHHQGLLVSGASQGVTLVDVDSTRFGNVVVMGAHTLTADPDHASAGVATLINCRLYSRKTPLSVSYRTEFFGRWPPMTGGGGNTNDGFVEARDCHFGLDSDAFNGGTNAVNNCVKLDRIIGFRFVNCDFHESNKYAFWVEGGSTYAPISKMALIEGCRFHKQLTAANSVGIFAQPSCKTITISDCRFDTTNGISIGDAEHIITGCHFFGHRPLRNTPPPSSPGGSAIVSDDGSDARVFMSNFYIGPGDDTGFLHNIMREDLESVPPLPEHSLNYQWVFRDGYIDDAAPGGSGLLMEAGNIVLERVTFNVSKGADALHAKSGTIEITNCKNIGQRSFYFSTSNGLLNVKMHGNIFDYNGPNFHSIGNALFVDGEENIFGSGPMVERGGGLKVHGNLLLKKGISNKAPEEWKPGMPYAVGDIRSTTAGQVYECFTSGISASSGDGPALYGSATISTEDNRSPGNAVDIVDGTVHWRWVRANKGNYRYHYDPTRKTGLLIQTWSADFTMIDEDSTPTINNIDLETPASGSNAGNVLCGGTLTLYAVQPFILGNSGNIAAAATAIRAVGAIVRLHYVNPLRKWVEV